MAYRLHPGSSALGWLQLGSCRCALDVAFIATLWLTLIPAVRAQSAGLPAAAQPAVAQPTATAPPSDPTTAALQDAADRAIRFVLAREALDPAALIPSTGQPLPTNGVWSVARPRPAACPTISEDANPATSSNQSPASSPSCLRVLYQVPHTEVSCEWVVLFQPDSVHATILEQNLDSIRYLLRTVPLEEVRPLILTRALPLSPRGNVFGVVELRVYVGTNGDPIRIIPIRGPAALLPAATNAAHQWLFRPLIAGSRALPYQITLKFNFAAYGHITSEP